MKHYTEDGDFWVDGPGYCLNCDREWVGKGEAHCSECCQHFTSDDAFDLHLASASSEEICMPPASVRKKDGKTAAFILIERSHGPTWMVNRPDLSAKEEAFPHLRASSDAAGR